MKEWMLWYQDFREQIKKNQELSDEFALNSSDACLHKSNKIEELMGMTVKYAESALKSQAIANGTFLFISKATAVNSWVMVLWLDVYHKNIPSGSICAKCYFISHRSTTWVGKVRVDIAARDKWGFAAPQCIQHKCTSASISKFCQFLLFWEFLSFF